VPLLDHFHPPVDPRAVWQSFHTRWAVSIADQLDRALPDRFFARVEANLGPNVAADVTEYETTGGGTRNGSAVAVVPQTYAPPKAETVAIVFPEEVLVEVRDAERESRVVAVIELVSPSNKDREETRKAFAAKCASYLTSQIGLLIVDAVTNRRFNLHHELLTLLGTEPGAGVEQWIYASSYRPVRRDSADLLDYWVEPLEVGRPLPTMPLSLRGAGVIPLDLEASYMDASRRSRLV
jgi:hypothetical protein